MPSAEIITIGTELLLGETVDTNTRHIARTLRSLGVDLYRTITIGDNVERIAEAIRESLSRADIIITTGGLGPTIDDPTREAVARAIGVKTEFRPELWEQVQARIARYGRKPGENQKRQARIPQGAIAIENPVGTAPAFIVEKGNGCVISLPGVPREMETLLSRSVVPYLQKRYDLRDVIKVRVLHVSGIGEGTIDERIADLETLNNPTVGLAAHVGVVDVRIAAKAPSEAEADALIAPVETDIRARLGTAVFGADDDTLEGVALQAAARRGWRVVLLTSGLDDEVLANRLQAVNPGNLLLIKQSEPADADALMAEVHALRQKHQAHIGLGVKVTPAEGQTNLDIVFESDDTRIQRARTYGGHPKNALRWARHLTLNLLRLQANVEEI